MKVRSIRIDVTSADGANHPVLSVKRDTRVQFLCCFKVLRRALKLHWCQPRPPLSHRQRNWTNGRSVNLCSWKTLQCKLLPAGEDWGSPYQISSGHQLHLLTSFLNKYLINFQTGPRHAYKTSRWHQDILLWDNPTLYYYGMWKKENEEAILGMLFLSIYYCTFKIIVPYLNLFIVQIGKRPLKSTDR